MALQKLCDEVAGGNWTKLLANPLYAHFAYVDAEVCVGLTDAEKKEVRLTSWSPFLFSSVLGQLQSVPLVLTLHFIAQVAKEHNERTVWKNEWDVKFRLYRAEYENLTGGPSATDEERARIFGHHKV